MKKIFIIFVIFVFCINLSTFACDKKFTSKTGRWAEKISERVVMDIYQDKKGKEYSVFITWREGNLAQKDIYRFKAKFNSKGELEYKNGIHIYRYYDSRNKFEDKIDYIDGKGTFNIRDNEIIWTDFKDNNSIVFISANKDLIKDSTVKNKLFSITLPEELRGLYEVKKEKDKISIFHKDSKNSGFGGFAFGIKAYRNPSDHAVLPGSIKLGELKDKNNNLYDIVLKQPTDVQYDYTKGSNPPESYKLLYDIGEIINIQGIKGSTYYKNQGMKGEDLYQNILQKHLTALKEKWDSIKLENEDMSYMYNVITQTNADALSKVGYIYYDVNKDGIEELLIGEIAEGAWKGVIYDIYTMVNREPKHVISGGSRNRYYICDESFVCNEYSSGAMESGVRVYSLIENSTVLYPQVAFKYDAYTNSENPWFISYSSDFLKDNWENTSETIYKERKKVFDKYERFNFVPFSKIK